MGSRSASSFACPGFAILELLHHRNPKIPKRQNAVKIGKIAKANMGNCCRWTLTLYIVAMIWRLGSNQYFNKAQPLISPAAEHNWSQLVLNHVTIFTWVFVENSQARTVPWAAILIETRSVYGHIFHWKIWVPSRHGIHQKFPVCHICHSRKASDALNESLLTSHHLIQNLTTVSQHAVSAQWRVPLNWSSKMRFPVSVNWRAETNDCKGSVNIQIWQFVEQNKLHRGKRENHFKWGFSFWTVRM